MDGLSKYMNSLIDVVRYQSLVFFRKNFHIYIHACIARRKKNSSSFIERTEKNRWPFFSFDYRMSRMFHFFSTIIASNIENTFVECYGFRRETSI